MPLFDRNASGRDNHIVGSSDAASRALSVIAVETDFVAGVYDKLAAVYDARETGYTEPSWLLCRAEMLQVAPGLALAFLETVVLAAISVAISTRLPMLANFIISFSIYVLGHLTPLLVQSQSVADNVPAPVVFLANVSIRCKSCWEGTRPLSVTTPS